MRKAKFTLLMFALVAWIAVPAYAGVAGADCLSAIGISCSNEVVSVLENNTGTPAPDEDPCGQISILAPTQWFVYTPANDAEVTASTCDAADFDTEISVFSGSCGALACVGNNDDAFGCGLTSEFSWSAEGGTTYYIAISGFGGATGTYTLSLTCEDSNNDLCSSAFALECGETVSGSTAEATFDDVGFCGTSNTAPGVWYQFVGVNGSATLSTCNQAGYDTKITVFEGSCEGLSCVGGNDDGAGCSGFTSELTVGTTAGTTYYVLVHGFSSATGTFDLTLTCDEAGDVENDICTDAIEVSCGDFVEGTTDGATFDGIGSCGLTISSPGVWYLLDHPGGQVILTTCSGSTDFDTKLSVFAGTCEDFECVGTVDDDPSCPFSGLQSTGILTAPAGPYLILITGFGSATGDFGLTIDCIEPPANDLPCDAEELIVGVEEDFTNLGATADDGEVSPGAGTGASSCESTDGWCSFETGIQNSVWFYFEAPASGAVSIDVDEFDFQLAVWTRDLCFDYGTYVEVGANDDDGGFAFSPYLELTCLTPGETYYVQIDGFGGGSSDGSILVSDLGGTPLTCDAGGCQTKFVGYEPAEGLNHLVVEPSGGTPPYSISWSGPDIVTNPNLATISVNPSSTSTYTATVTDATGCSTECSVEVLVVDVRCGNRGNKISLCHVPPGDPENPQEMCLGYPAIAAHLNAGHGGDYLGFCGNTCMETNEPPAPCVNVSVDILTDNFPSETSWELRDVLTAQLIASGDAGSETGTLVNVYSSCLPAGCYSVTVFDSFGDGICCGFGEGTYYVTYDGTTTESPSGGNFGDSETLTVGEGCPSCVEVSVDILTDNFPSETSWELANSANLVIASGDAGSATSTLVNVFSDCIPEGCYTLTVFDEFGDGICCGFGAGTYTVTYDGVTTESPSGGAFGDEESLQFGDCGVRVEQSQDIFEEDDLSDATRKNSSISFYPNPFSSYAVLSVKPAMSGDAVIDILDLSGRVITTVFNGSVVEGQTINHEISAKEFGAPGVYMYRVTIGGETFVDKFIFNE